MNRPTQASLFEWAAPRVEEPPRGILDVSALELEAWERSELLKLQRELERRLGVVDLIFTDNRRRMVSLRPGRGRTEVRLHHMFVGCDSETIDALAGLLKNNEAARLTIRDFIRRNSEAIREHAEDALVSNGEHYDLETILTSVRGLVEDAPESIRITWGKDGRGQRTIRLGSYEFDQKLIRIHPALDRSWVPHYFVEFVVYHELLHAVFPPSGHGRRRALHPPAFRAREQEFPRFAEAMAWEKANIQRLLNR